MIICNKERKTFVYLGVSGNAATARSREYRLEKRVQPDNAVRKADRQEKVNEFNIV